MIDLRTDEQLMVAAGEGDDVAFETLVLRLRDGVNRFLRHLGCDPQTVDDLTQETLLRLWTSRNGYEPRAALRTYALTIAKNLWLSSNRRPEPALATDATTGRSDGLDGLALADLLPPSPERELFAKYRALRIREAIIALPPRQRIVFVLSHIEDLPYAEIGRILGIAEGTVKSRMHRAIRNLRHALERDASRPASEED